MAENANEYQVGCMYYVTPDKLVPSPELIRSALDMDRVTLLKNSIIKMGMISPLLVQAQPDGKFLIVDGHQLAAHSSPRPPGLSAVALRAKEEEGSGVREPQRARVVETTLNPVPAANPPAPVCVQGPPQTSSAHLSDHSDFSAGRKSLRRSDE